MGVEQDGVWGPKSQAALNSLLQGGSNGDGVVHIGRASSFADPSDVAAFERCKARGGTDDQCAKVGDNGVGEWGDSTVEGSGPSCAVSPDDMISKWGSIDAARHKAIQLTANGKTVTTIVKDRMPWAKDITNGAVIDCNPDTCRELGMEPPMMIDAKWVWA